MTIHEHEGIIFLYKTDITSYILFPELIFVWEPFHDNTRLMILEVNLSWGLVLTVLQSDIRVC